MPLTDRSSRTVAAGEGETLWFGGAHQTIKCPGEWSDEKFSLVEVAAPRGRATPLHRDPSDETFYVLAGELLFHLDGEECTAGVGDTLAVRRGVPHAFIVTSEIARFLVLNTPGTHDRYFRDGGDTADDASFATAPAPDLEKIEASNRKHGVEVLGPPPFSPPDAT